VDACRIAWRGPEDAAAAAVGFGGSRARGSLIPSNSFGRFDHDSTYDPGAIKGRWPANVVLDEEAARMLDEQSGERDARHGPDTPYAYDAAGGTVFGGDSRIRATFGYGDTGGASRFFYTAKASRSEREAGLRDGGVGALRDGGVGALRDGGRSAHVRNHHPTVKPLDLMCWLVRLVTPPGGLVLDPFAGSGTTIIAALRQGFRGIGIEREADYCALARRRIAEDAPLFSRTAP
jgi:site-specific DNA-methyltransferase (adenine-specific)